MAPHLNLCIVARGINVGLNTRMYFADETAANQKDPVLNLIEQVHRPVGERLGKMRTCGVATSLTWCLCQPYGLAKVGGFPAPQNKAGDSVKKI